MKSSECQLEAPATTEFCPGDGARLSACRQPCGTANAAGNRFCKKCGQPLAAAAVPAVERLASPHAS